MTKQRELILNIIKNSCEHMTADQIFTLAKQQMPSLAIGTVYRNLKLMFEAGDILHIPVADAPDRYDKTVTAHDHLICDKCKCVVDLPGGSIRSMLEDMAKTPITSYDLIVHFVCENCR